MSVKEFHLIKELTYSRLTAICAFELPRFLPTSCANHYLNHVFTSSMVVLILRLFSETLAELVFFPLLRQTQPLPQV